MKSNYRKIVAMLAIVLYSGSMMAQCAMCKAVVESNNSAGGKVSAGINNGIVYLMGVPYLLIGVAGYFVYRNYKKNSSEAIE